MPNSKSAKKRLRQNVVRRDRNKAIKSALRSQLRKVREAVQAGDVGKAESEMQVATKRLDRAGQRNIIHKNTAARTKSRMQKLIKNAKQSS
ncbi:MAG TPA: 30S ribosomal protein S20 [Pirellulaceae bacterium]|nr:30S ribosomal protein S20 [Planctomycetales bacterium]MCB9937859.1 30S ribosomal protein S20 [Planctomycetaceae bacterium]HRX82220.1 30S ribosomal protein S20 [Pirellulaceae bacterium]